MDDEEDGAPREGSVPSGPQEGERAPSGGSETPPQPVVPEGSTEPRPASGADAGGSAEASCAETTVEAPTPTARETGVLGASGGAKGAASTTLGAS